MNDIHPLFLALKRQLKSRKISYAELAARTDMSEANVKRIFSEESCSVNRLAQICDAIQISLVELMQSANEIEPEKFMMSEEIENFFADNLDYFVFFRQLENGYSAKNLLTKHHLSQKDFTRYLKKIEELGLIERLPNDRIRMINAGYLRLRENSRLRDLYFRRWVPSFFERVLHPHEKHFVKIFSTGLSEKNRQSLIRELEDVARKYHEIGYFDQLKGTNPFEAVGVCIGLGPYRVGEDQISTYRKR